VYYIEIKDNTDPWLNLALEEYTVRNLDRKRDYLLLYVNQSSLIVGKHQNVLEEVNLDKAGELGIPIIRRISGGGTVYHDPGNLNICVITSHTLRNFNKYSNFLKPVLEVLKELSLPVRLNERNNIVLDDKKISGNAQFTSKQRLLSHGTLLVNTDLNMMDKLIKYQNNDDYQSKSTKSVRSKVTNIYNHLNESITVKDISQRILNKIYGNNIEYFNFNVDDWTEIEKLADKKYKSWQWNYSLSPQCKIQKKIESETGEIDFEMVVDRGIIRSMKLINSDIKNSIKESIYKYFINKSLDYITIKDIVLNIQNDYLIKPLDKIPWSKILLN
jgi:lipoate-protein ligase A